MSRSSVRTFWRFDALPTNLACNEGAWHSPLPFPPGRTKLGSPRGKVQQSCSSLQLTSSLCPQLRLTTHVCPLQASAGADRHDCFRLQEIQR